jgi:hypothetical protein
MTDRFDFEDNLMKCWHVTDDIDMVANLVAEMELPAKDQDRLMNILIGLKELYNARFSATFGLFEELLHQQVFPEMKLKNSLRYDTLDDYPIHK